MYGGGPASSDFSVRIMVVVNEERNQELGMGWVLYKGYWVS